MTVLLPTFRIQEGYGPCSWPRSLWQWQVGLPQRVVRSTRVPGRHGPSLAISAATWRRRRGLVFG